MLYVIYSFWYNTIPNLYDFPSTVKHNRISFDKMYFCTIINRWITAPPPPPPQQKNSLLCKMLKIALITSLPSEIFFLLLDLFGVWSCVLFVELCMFVLETGGLQLSSSLCLSLWFVSYSSWVSEWVTVLSICLQWFVAAVENCFGF